MLVMLRLTPFVAHLMLVMVLNMPEHCSFQEMLFHVLFMPKYAKIYASIMDISLPIIIVRLSFPTPTIGISEYVQMIGCVLNYYYCCTTVLFCGPVPPPPDLCLYKCKLKCTPYNIIRCVSNNYIVCTTAVLWTRFHPPRLGSVQV